MFSPDHEIWKFAYAGDELDDWLLYAEDLVHRWTGQSHEEVEFGTTFEIILAALMCMDDLLPVSARRAFAKCMLDAISEADERKLTLTALHVRPPQPGRKEDRRALFHRTHEVIELLQKGHPKQEAYESVAKMFHKSPDTIRRDYERWISRRRKKGTTGEIDQ
jgi:hypothetical protein